MGTQSGNGSELDLSTLRKVADATRDGLAISDARRDDMPLVYVNPAFEEMTGYAAAEVIGRNCRFLQGDQREQKGLDRVRRAIAAQGTCLVTLRNFRKDGQLFYNELSLSPLLDDAGRLTHYIGIQKDVTARVVREQLVWERGAELERLNRQLQRLAAVDDLTGLHNRRMFSMTLNREWRRALRTGTVLSLFIVDVDGFKGVNDNHGHPAGDASLRKIAGALSRVFSRAVDYVARYGGDEFVVLSAGLSPSAALGQGERVLAAVRELRVPGVDATLSVSVGIATAEVVGELVEQDLLAAADTALYRAKNAGRDRLELITLGGVRPGGQPG